MDHGALSAATLCEAFQATVAERPGQVALRTPGGGVTITWEEYGRRVARIAAGLAGLGVSAGDTVGIMMVNRPEFHLVDTAALHLGATPFSIYNTSSPDQIEYLFGHAANRVVLCQEVFVERLQAAGLGTKLEHIICVDGAPEGTIPLAELEEAPPPAGFDFDRTWRAISPEDVVTLIYTSGTTGPPKGVEITHANVMAQLRAVHAVLPWTPGGRTVSFLPTAHIADRALFHYCSMVFGLELTDVPDPRLVVAALPEVRPTYWGSVPRIWEKIKAALDAQVETEPDEGRRQAMKWALGVALAKLRAEQAGEPVSPELAADFEKADALVLSKIREKLGLDQAEWLVVGAAPTPRDVLEFFAAIGLPLCEVWGMSELSGLGTAQPPGGIRIGTVGRGLPGMEFALAADGELLCRGPVVMKGYRNDPERTAETIGADGWLQTGDIAAIDDDGYITIVDRKKEIIINAAGKNMSPANIESRLKSSSPLIGQAVCIGDGQPYNVALLVLDPDGAAAHGDEHGLPDASAQVLADDDGVRQTVAAAVEEANSHLSRVEQIKRFLIVPVDWEPGGDELTPTMKLKRRPIAAKYAVQIEALYAVGG
ncbi:MAG: AMP-dependent synthetase/ligase [Acidimicrobiia bacterium]